MAKAPTKAKAKAPAKASTNGTAKASTRPRLTVGSELTDQEPFLAQVQIDEWSTGDFGEQIHLAVKPLEFEVAADKTGMFHEWYKGGTKSTSKCGALLAGLKKIGVPEETAVGDGELVGTIAWFIRKDMEFGKDRNTGETLKAEQVLLPHASASAEDMARVKTKVSKGGGKANTPDEPEWTDDEIAAVLKVIEGKKQAQFQIAAARSKIAPDLKNAILSGEAVKYLLGLGLIEVSKAGVVTSTLEEGGDDEEEETETEEEEDDDDDEEEGEEDEEDEVPV